MASAGRISFSIPYILSFITLILNYLNNPTDDARQKIIDTCSDIIDKCNDKREQIKNRPPRKLSNWQTFMKEYSYAAQLYLRLDKYDLKKCSEQLSIWYNKGDPKLPDDITPINRPPKLVKVKKPKAATKTEPKKLIHLADLVESEADKLLNIADAEQPEDDSADELSAVPDSLLRSVSSANTNKVPIISIIDKSEKTRAEREAKVLKVLEKYLEDRQNGTISLIPSSSRTTQLTN